jgi:hypothetical protein
MLELYYHDSDRVALELAVARPVRPNPIRETWLGGRILAQ